MITYAETQGSAPNFIAVNVLLSLVTEAKRVGLTELPIASLEEVLIKLKG